jgi:L-alanine-DL-glutamate epimerase-like enolase superfamily enzyme
MELTFKKYLLEFRHPFGLSSHSRNETPVVFLRLSQQDTHGYGEACLPAYLGETVAGTIEFFESVRELLRHETIGTAGPFALIEKILAYSAGTFAAKAAIDMALHDIWGKLNGRPCYKLFGSDDADPKMTSYTIAIDSEEKIGQKIREAEDFGILKIKAGTKDDEALIRLIRKFTSKPLYVDINQGWTDRNFALRMTTWMKDQDILLLEQPMPKSMKEEMKWLASKSPIPIIADESVQGMDDLRQLNGSFSGINIKLMKCGGLAEARKMIELAKETGIRVMLGCMAESSCGTTAMAQLMRYGDFIDLDAPLLYKNDAFTGIVYRNGKAFIPDEPGIGVRPKYNLFE